jgi:hypothetical protein
MRDVMVVVCDDEDELARHTTRTRSYCTQRPRNQPEAPGRLISGGPATCWAAPNATELDPNRKTTPTQLRRLSPSAAAVGRPH